MALALLFAGRVAAQAPSVPKPLHLATGISLQFVSMPVAPQPPDYTAIKKANDARVAAEAAAEAARRAQQAQAEAQAVQPVKVAYVAPTPAVAPTGSEAYYKLWIYNEESGNNPTRWNTSGCLGLGQACPAAKLLLVCPTEDYICEDNWFTSYMLARYGSWYNAYLFHIARGWW